MWKPTKKKEKNQKSFVKMVVCLELNVKF
uniref:Uncharacterized protein n=1 Tax=Rhizophora mucronata TaxID=61149 RepID=A0A2P2QJA4_RHIMU